MGYITRFKITYDATNKSIPQCNHKVGKAKFCPECGEKVRQIPLYDLIENAIAHHEYIKYAQYNCCKWYSYQEDMIAFSKQFKDVVFKVHGEGEESGDIWDAYFLNGKSQVHKAKILIDECDPKAWK